MDIDLRRVPFSRNGSFLAFSLLQEVDNLPEGLYLRSVHGGAANVQANGRLAFVEVIENGRPVPYQIKFFPSQLDLHTENSLVSLCIAEPFVLRIRGEGAGLRLTFDPLIGAFASPGTDRRCRVNCPAYGTQFMFSPLEGRCLLDAPWTGVSSRRVAVELQPNDPGGVCEAAIEEYESVWRPRAYDEPFLECITVAEADFDLWLDQTPELPEKYEPQRELAAFITWSCMVEPLGMMLRPAMLMSKNGKNRLMNWGACFNALALAYHKPMVGWDQLMSLFDQQDEHGGLPDDVDDRGTSWSFTKPPLQGWTLDWMMRHSSFFRLDQMRQIYGPMCRSTEWWLRYRDDDRDGLPQYQHGFDSGWDNATPFEAGLPLESPDLCTFLIIQMETLARLAMLLNQEEEAESWLRRSKDLLQKMLAHFWQGDHFVALRSGDHLVSDHESLLMFVPLMLGERLPAAVRHDLLEQLVRPGRFLTPHGFATESPLSLAYQPDGFYRGPIWAHTTLFIVEGLEACGEHELAVETARRFCDLVVKSGFCEQYNALTGRGLNDPAYSWTASIFLVLAHEYLLD
jgi:hypothetical protein